MLRMQILLSGFVVTLECRAEFRLEGAAVGIPSARVVRGFIAGGFARFRGHAELRRKSSPDNRVALFNPLDHDEAVSTFQV